MKSKKRASYKNGVIKMFLLVIIGMVIGGVTGKLYFTFGENMTGVTGSFLVVITKIMLPLLSLITVITVLGGEYCYNRLKKIGVKILETEYEECDKWEYEEERWGGILVNLGVVSQVLCFVILSTGYSIHYIQEVSDQRRGQFLVSCIIFIICYFYNAIAQTRYVKLVQKIHPEKQGDPFSKGFQKEFLGSCDEAEKEVIYKSAYHTYVMMQRTIGILLVITMLLHLFFNTGLLAVIVVGVIYLVSTFSYTHSCVQLRKRKIS